MDTNQDNYDLGYIQIIKNQEFLYKDFDFKEKSVNNYSKNHFSLNNQEFINQEIDENVRKYYEYFQLNDKNGFICKYEDCEQIETFEDLMVSHVLKHLTLENKIQVIDGFKSDLTHFSTHDSNQSQDYKDLNTENDLKINANKSNDKRSSDRIANNNKTGVYVCDWKGCKTSFTSWTPFESHKSEHLIQKIIVKERKSPQNVSPKKTDYEDLEKYFEVINKNGKDMFVCKWKTCDYKSCLLRVIRRHILNDHLNRESSVEEINYWNQFLNNNSTHEGSHLNSSTKSVESLTKSKSSSYSSGSQISTKTPNLEKIKQISDTKSPEICPITSTPNFKTEANEGIEIELLHNQNVNVSLSEDNVLLSCKGLASMAKVAQYFEKKVIDGEKTYFCKWNERCQFKTKRSQKIAEHININHIGCEFKCHKPNCNKVFKTPHSWRQHQKNHFCNFGIYGYGKNVIGVCRNENLNKYSEKVIVDNKRSFRCTYNGCGALSKYNKGMKRHIHNQHICPYRVNLHIMRNQNRNIKTEEPPHEEPPHEQPPQDQDLDLDSNLANNQMFECKQRECNAKFAVYSDLIQHQNVLCKYKKVAKTTNSTQSTSKKTNKLKHVANTKKPEDNRKQSNIESLDYSKDNTTKSKEGIVRNTDVSQSLINGNTKLERVNEPQSQINVDKYFVTKLYDGVNYHLCKWNDCKFTTKFENKIVEHIQTQHLGYELQPNSCNAETVIQNIDLKRKHSFGYQQNSHKYQKVDTNKVGVEVNEKINNNNNNNNSIEKKFISPIHSEPTNANNLKQYIEKKCIDGKSNYFCKWNDCKHYENSLNGITEHINETHIRFTCDIENCLKSFKNEDIFRVHKINHICGFGITGRKSIGVCDLDNIRKYRVEEVVGDKYVYSCKWSECAFTTESRSIALSHVHNRHICPNRQIPKVKLIQRSTVGQRSEANNSKSATNRSLSNQNEYTCKRPNCEAKFKTHSGLLKHENNLCQFRKYDKINVKNEFVSNHRNEGRKESFTQEKRSNSTEMIGSETSVDNFQKYCKVGKKDGKPLYICIYPNCCFGPKSRTQDKSFRTPNKANMIRHICKHCLDEPFVCRLDGCERNFSDSTSHNNHQQIQHNIQHNINL